MFCESVVSIAILKLGTEKLNNIKSSYVMGFVFLVLSMVIGGWVFELIKVATQSGYTEFLAISLVLPLLWVLYDIFSGY